MGKGLNPAAQGFSFSPAQSRPGDDRDGDPSPFKPDNTPSFASIQSAQSGPSIPKGHVEPAPNGHAGAIQQAWTAPIMVDEEKLKGIGGRRISGDSNVGGSLGLTQMEAPAPTPDIPPAPTPIPTASVMTQSTSTPAMSTSPTTPTTPVLVQTPRVPTGSENSLNLSPKLVSSSQSQVNRQWNFVGPSMSGYISPPPSATVPSFSQAMSARSASSSAPPRRRIAMSTDAGPLRLRPTRPEAGSTSENAYNSSLSGAIPKTVRTEQVAVNEDTPKLSAKGKGKASGKRVVFAAGVDEAEMARMGVERKAGQGLIFGSVADDLIQPLSTLTAPPDIVSDRSTGSEAVPILKPPPKPTSWAALFNDASKPFSRTSSVPSSVLVSPSKSVISLATESEAGPSRLPTEPTTPRSTAPTFPPSTGASVASAPAPRPVFNYAAAAAAGANLTPQEEFARLLTDGLKGRARYAPVCLPRGLINTGNMCFANTVSHPIEYELDTNPLQILQVLVNCPPFTTLLEELSKRLHADLARRTPLLEAM